MKTYACVRRTRDCAPPVTADTLIAHLEDVLHDADALHVLPFADHERCAHLDLLVNLVESYHALGELLTAHALEQQADMAWSVASMWLMLRVRGWPLLLCFRKRHLQLNRLDCI